jgi:hypothetical protein
VRMGEVSAARAYATTIQSGALSPHYSPSLARWAACRALEDTHVAHAIAAVLRALRLWSMHPDRLEQQPPGQLLRHLGLITRKLLDRAPPEALREELSNILGTTSAIAGTGNAADVERALLDEVSRATGWAALASLQAPTKSGMVIVGAPNPGEKPRVRVESA